MEQNLHSKHTIRLDSNFKAVTRTRCYQLYLRRNKKFLASALQNERLLIAQNAVLEAFRQANIAVAVLKGSSAARYYPQPELRALGDIDLLINKSDIPAAREMLLHEEYKENALHEFSKKLLLL